MGASTVEFRGRRNPLDVPRPRLNGTIKCMANPRRVAMVAKQIWRELSDMLVTDKNLQYAVQPEAALGADHYLSSVTTISDVEISGDLRVIFSVSCILLGICRFLWNFVGICGSRFRNWSIRVSFL